MVRLGRIVDSEKGELDGGTVREKGGGYFLSFIDHSQKNESSSRGFLRMKKGEELIDGLDRHHGEKILSDSIDKRKKETILPCGPRKG